MQDAETWRQRCHEYQYTRATRKPAALTLGKKLHDEIGYSFRKYQRLSGCRHDPVQSLTRCFLEALQLRIGGLEGTPGSWLAKPDDVSCPVPVLTLSEPPGLERHAELSCEMDDETELLGSTVISLACVKDRAEVTHLQIPSTGQSSYCSSESSELPTQAAHTCTTPPPRPKNLSTDCFEASPAKCARDSEDQRLQPFHQKCTNDAAEATASLQSADGEDLKSNSVATGRLEETAVPAGESTPSSTQGLQDLHRLTVSLEGDSFSAQRRGRMVQQFVDGASHAMMSKGFSSIKDGIKVDSVSGATATGAFELSFPDAISTIAFFMMFDDYHWESDNYHCLVVRLSSAEYHSQLSSPILRSRFAALDAITPGRISEVLQM